NCFLVKNYSIYNVVTLINNSYKLLYILANNDSQGYNILENGRTFTKSYYIFGKLGWANAHF
ncbi:hypothetical protein Q8G40_30640, partial [Klebsiella pneumoniae]|uniref:hypothetical protein n=1 Tax=Klebsiella pneumoniae TaxID=573 RepID=UPI0030134356